MSVFSNIFGWLGVFLKGALKVAQQELPDIVSAYSPPLGIVVEKVLTAIVGAEAIGQPDKRQFVQASIALAMDQIDDAFRLAGKEIRDPQLFADGVDSIREGLVKLLDATGEPTAPTA